MTEGTNGIRALVIGGGIGGVTAGYALNRAGISTTVFERATDPSTIYVGSGIHLWNNAMRALKAIGLDTVVTDITGPSAVVEHMEFFTPKGKRLADVRLGKIAHEVGGDCVGINRAELLPALAGALPPGILELGKTFTRFEQDDDGVTAHFADGTERRGDVLIGADGVASRVRTQLLGDSPPRYAGYTIWQGITSFPHESAEIGRFPLVYGPGLRFAYYRVNEERLYWFAVSNAPEGEREPDEARKPLLLDRFRAWPEPIAAIIESTSPGAIHRRDLYDRNPDERWGEGRVTLLGDAAHAMTFDVGQGAGQSIEDAVVLAQCLSRTSPPPDALREYEQRRMQRTAHMQKLSRRVGQLGRWRNPVAVGARNAFFRMLGAGPAAKALKDDLTYDFLAR